MIKFLDLTKQYNSIKKEIDTAILSVINDAAFISGKYAKKFEEEFAQYQNSDYCVSVGNGTDAIEIALEALEIPRVSEVIVPANSFIASSEAVTRSGMKVVFCDCDPANYTISVKDVEARITPRTAAVIAVHLYGHPCDLDALSDICRKHGIKLIEDCAQAHGAEYKGKRIGALGDVGCFSFYPGKNLGAYGDAGAIITNDSDLAEKCRMIANHGRIEKYNHEFEGRNSRMDGIQAAILSIKLKYLEKWTDIRRQCAQTYREGLRDCTDIILPVEESWARHVYHLFVIRTEKRDGLERYLTDKKIQTGIHYPIALPKLKAYRYVNQFNDDMLANRYDSRILSLPMGDHLTEKDLRLVIDIINGFFE